MSVKHVMSILSAFLQLFQSALRLLLIALQSEDSFDFVDVSIKALPRVSIHDYFSFAIDDKLREVPGDILDFSCFVVIEAFCVLA